MPQFIVFLSNGNIVRFFIRLLDLLRINDFDRRFYFFELRLNLKHRRLKALPEDFTVESVQLEAKRVIKVEIFDFVECSTKNVFFPLVKELNVFQFHLLRFSFLRCLVQLLELVSDLCGLELLEVHADWVENLVLAHGCQDAKLRLLTSGVL